MNIQVLLNTFYFDNKDKLFEWGAWDCAYISKTWVELATPKQIKIPDYSTMKQAAKLDLVDLVDANLTRISSPNHGDIVAFKQQDRRLTLGIKMSDSILSISEKGLIPVYFKVKYAWGIE